MVVVVVVVVAALWACFIMSFKPFGRSGRVTHATADEDWFNQATATV